MSSNEETAEIFLEAANLIERTGWARRSLARDDWGRHVSVNDPRAVSFCLVGSVVRTIRSAERNGSEDCVLTRLDIAVAALKKGSLCTGIWNDRIYTSAEEAIAMLHATATYYALKS